MISFHRTDFSPPFVKAENCFNVAKNSFDRGKNASKVLELIEETDDDKDGKIGIRRERIVSTLGSYIQLAK